MKTWVKWALAGGLLILSTPLLLAAFVVLFLDQDHYKAQLSDAVEWRTGRPLIIEGDLKLAAGVKPRFYAETIRYPNADWGKQPWAIEVDKAVFAVDLWALLHGKLLVEDIVLEKPRLWVEKNPAGVYNLAVLRRSQSKSGAPRTTLPWGLDVSGARVINGEISVAARNRHWDVRIHDARATSGGPGQPVVVDFRGAVEDTPVTASATLGSLETLFTWQPSPLSVNGHVGGEENRVRATGSAKNLLKWRGVDLNLEFDLAHPAELSALAARPLPPQLGTVKGNARFDQPGRLSTMALRDIQLASAKWGLRGVLSGEIARLYNRTGIDLNFSAAGTLDRAPPVYLVALTGRDDAAAPLKAGVTARVHGSSRDLNLHIENATLENPALSIAARGEVGFVDGAWRGSLPVSLTLNNAGDAGDAGKPEELPGRALSSIGPLTAEAELTRDQGAWRLSDVKLSVEREALSIKVAGAVNQLTTRPSGLLYVIAEAEDDRYLRPLFDDPPPPDAVADLKLEAALAFSPGVLRATVDQLSGQVYGVALSASGGIAELNRLRGIDLAISGEATGLQDLPPPPGRAWPASGAVRVDAKLADDESGALHLTGISASVASLADAPGASFDLAARGEIRNLGASMAADLDVELALADAGPVQTLFAGSQAAAFLQAVTPLKASGNLYSLAPADWRMRDIKAASQGGGPGEMGATMTGEVAAFAPLDARLRVALSDLAVAGLPAAWNVPRPRGGMLDVSLDLSARRGEVSVKNITAALDSAEVSMAAQGDIDRLKPIAVNNMEVKFEAASVAALEWPAIAGLNPGNAVSGIVTMRATGARSNHSTVDLQIGANDMRGKLDWGWPEDPKAVPEVKADLRSGRFYLAEILATPATKKTRFFSAAPINTNWIHKLNGRIDLAATAAGSRLIDLRDAHAQLVLKDGTLAQTVAGQMGQGKLAMRLGIDARSQPFSAEFKMNGKDLDAGGLVAFRTDNFIDNGTFDADIEISATGASMAELASAADGRVSLGLNRAKMKNQTLDFIGGDIFSNLVTIINPFRSIGEYIDIECGVVHFDVARGMAVSENRLALKTDKVTLLGGGVIDLDDESLKILITPKARKGFGINPSSLAKIVRLGGTLAEPKIEADSSRLPETVAAVWAALYSGGLSLLAQGWFDRNQANADVCGLAGGAKVKELDVSVQPGKNKE